MHEKPTVFYCLSAIRSGNWTKPIGAIGKVGRGRTIAGFWYPYEGALDALNRLAPFADRAVGHGCGISYSDGKMVAVVRRPSAGQTVWMNVLVSHVTAPRPRPIKRPPNMMQRVEQWFEAAMTAYGQAEMTRQEINRAAARQVEGYVNRDIWQPTHRWLLRHKLIADGVGVAADVLGVVAGTAFFFFVLPEVGLVAGAIGLAAAAGSGLLLAADGYVYFTELTDDETQVKIAEKRSWVQWSRIVGTLMTLPDMTKGGPRALKEVAALSAESRMAGAAARTSAEAAEAQRMRAARVRNPGKHPASVQKHLHKAKRFARDAKREMAIAHHASRRATLIAGRDVGAAYGAAPTSAALLTFSPPPMLLSEQQKRRDEAYLKQIEPAHGLPHDTRVEIRISTINHKAGR